MAARVSRKLRGEEALITEYSGVRLRMDLDRVPLWRGDRVGLSQLWSDYSQYLYLPRLRNSGCLLGAVRSGVALLTWNPDSFAYASAFDADTGRYSGLVGGQQASVVLDATSVLVKPDVASRQMEEDAHRGGTGMTTASGIGRERTSSALLASETDASAPPRRPTRFYGRVSLDPVRMLRDLDDIAEAIVAQLGRADAAVKISVEIDASADDGFPDDVRRTVSENARTLKFEIHEFDD
ncbi:MAG: hypothetical protein ACR2HY_05780 [Acidimicrobiales bacterium]